MVLGPALLATGARVEARHQTTLDMELNVRLFGRTLKRDLIRRHDQTVSMVMTSSGYRASWSTNRHQALEPGHTHDRVLPVVGNSYEVVDGSLVRPVSVEERDIVLAQGDLPSQLSMVRHALPGRLDIGTTVVAPTFLGALIDEAPGDPSVVSGTMVLQRIESGVASWSIEVHLRSSGVDPKGTSIQTDAHGSGWLDIDVVSGLVTRLSVAGDVQAKARRTGLQTDGSGTFSITTTFSYR